MGCIWPKNHQHFYVFLLHVNIYRNTVYCGLFLQSQTFKLEKELQKNCLVTNSELNGQEICLNAHICCQNPSLNPAQVTAAISKYLPDLTPDFVRICRREIYDTNNEIFR